MNLLAPGAEWTPAADAEHVFERRNSASGEIEWTATAVDLVFGSNAQLRGIAEVYASAYAAPKFVRDFAAAWGRS